MRIIELVVMIEVPDEESESSITILLSDLEEEAAKQGFDIYDTLWDEHQS